MHRLPGKSTLSRLDVLTHFETFKIPLHLNYKHILLANWLVY